MRVYSQANGFQDCFSYDLFWVSFLKKQTNKKTCEKFNVLASKFSTVRKVLDKLKVGLACEVRRRDSRSY